jgi:hypothetical protein
VSIPARVLEAVAPEGLVGRRRSQFQRGGIVLATTAFFLFFASDNRNTGRCLQECYGDASRDFYGSRPYEPGHAWTSYADSWQWSAQHGLTQLALLASFLGFAATFAERNPLKLYVVSTAALVTWAIWVALTPQPG